MFQSMTPTRGSYVYFPSAVLQGIAETGGFEHVGLFAVMHQKLGEHPKPLAVPASDWRPSPCVPSVAIATGLAWVAILLLLLSGVGLLI